MTNHYKQTADELSNLADLCEDEEAQQILRDGATKIRSLVPAVTISPEAQAILFNMRNKKK